MSMSGKLQKASSATSLWMLSFHSLTFKVPEAEGEDKASGLVGNLTPSGLPDVLLRISGNSCVHQKAT